MADIDKVLEQEKIGQKDTANNQEIKGFTIPKHKAVYLTWMDDNVAQLNSYISYTKFEKNIPLIISITTEKDEGLDIAPELSIQDAAKATKEFIKNLPDDIVDVDTGPGF